MRVMLVYKKKVMWGLLGIEIIFFACAYLISNNGLRALLLLKKDNERLCKDITTIKHDLHALEKELLQRHHYPYYNEKIAREKLHMAREDEFIYFLNERM